MIRVCLLGDEDASLPADLLAYETAREALAPYDLDQPFENAVCVDTISLGAAVALLNDLNWYLVRLTDRAIVRDPSVSETEWLSRALATAIRNGEVDPDETGELLEIYGVETPGEPDGPEDADVDGRDEPPDTASPPPRLTEPMFAQRIGDEIPEYDLRDVEETLVVRVTSEEFGA